MYKQTKTQMSMNTKTNGQITALQGKVVTDMRELMEQKGLSQRQMATLGISEGSLSDLLHERRAFSGALLSKIGKVLGDLQNGESRLFTSLRQYQKMIHVADFTRQQALFSLACGNTGIGKTTAIRHIYACELYTFYSKVEDDLTWRELLAKIATALGLSHLPYRTEALRSKLQHKVAQLSRPLLIIDEAEELTNSVSRKLKRLHTLTEGQLGVLIVAHPELKRRLARASGLHSEGQPRAWRLETQYATLWRRLTHFDLPPVSDEDIGKLCQQELHINDRAVVALAKERWTNYGYMARDLLVAEVAGLAWETMTTDEFQFITKT